MAVLVSIVSNHKKLVKKCAVTMKHFSNPGTMLVLVLEWETMWWSLEPNPRGFQWQDFEYIVNAVDGSLI